MPYAERIQGCVGFRARSRLGPSADLWLAEVLRAAVNVNLRARALRTAPQIWRERGKLAACNTLGIRCTLRCSQIGTIAIAPWAHLAGGPPNTDPRRGAHRKKAAPAPDARQPHHGPPAHRSPPSPPYKHAPDSASSPPTSSRSGPTCAAQFEASANGTRFLYKEDQRSLGPGPQPQFNVSRILQDETPAPTVKGKEDHCPRCWWRKSPPDPDHWWPAMTTTQRNGIGPVRWEGQVGGAERMSCPVGWGQVNKDNIRLRVEKKWERVCFYCWKAKLSDARDMERLIAHTTWDEQQYYRLFYIWGCGGMFGTPRFAAPGGCEKKSIEFKLEVDSKGRRVPEGPDGLHEVTIPLTKNTRPPLGFECCTRKLGCTLVAPRLMLVAMRWRSLLLWSGRWC